MTKLWKKLLAAKLARRKELAALPFSEKLALVEKMRDRSLLLASNPLRQRAARESAKCKVQSAELRQQAARGSNMPIQHRLRRKSSEKRK